MPVGDYLLVALLLVLLAILALVVQIRRAVQRDEIETEQLTAALHTTLSEMDFAASVSRIEDRATELRDVHQRIDRLLRVPRERGEFGEQQLEIILEDHLPPDMYGIRDRVVGNKTPDAHIETREGLVCIDSKFSLDAYERALDAEDPETRASHERTFRNQVDDQLAKVAADYVRPDEGTTDFAFAFVPSESVYYHLVTEEYDMLREYTKRGVQVVSPLTLGHKLELIKAGVQARKLSEEAAEILEHLDRLDRRFDEFEDEWSTLERHISNAHGKAEDVDREIGRLRDSFDRIEEPTTGGYGDYDDYDVADASDDG
ncbi:MAG: DNA recombination protein RmuC [Halanaeroarchaeum sp.]